MSDLSLAVKYFFVNEPVFEWKSGVDGCRGNREYKFQREKIAHASSFEALIVTVHAFSKAICLRGGEEEK